MKKSISLFLALTFALPAMGQSPVKSAPLLNWGGGENCGLKEYVAAFNAQNPPTELFIEDLTQVTDGGSPAKALVQIDRDENSAYLAAKVARCMIQPTLPTPNMLEKTLREAYELYFSDRASRRALWLFFQQVDAAYLSKEQRVAAHQSRESYWVNLAEGAYYGTWAATVMLWVLRRGRPAPTPIPAVSTSASALSGGMKESRIYEKLTRSMRFKEWTRGTFEFTAVTAAGGLLVGTPLYYARQYGLLSTKDVASVTEVERTHHRMHWLELDCRARMLKQELQGRTYTDSKDPQFAKDVRRVNYMLNDLNFLLDVSQLYYAEIDPPADMKIEGNNVTYRDSRVQCAPGFSKTNAVEVTIKDVQASVRTAGIDFLNLYAPFTANPVNNRLKAFLAKHKDEFAKALSESSPSMKAFFAKVEKDLPNSLGTPDNMLKQIQGYLGMRARLQGRKEFITEWFELLAKLPQETLRDLNAEGRNMISSLPPTLFNQMVLDYLSSGEHSPANLMFMFHMGFMLDDAAKQKMISGTDAYAVPNEFMFGVYGLLTGVPQ